jgi:predicted TPR repeat methyltransferase
MNKNKLDLPTVRQLHQSGQLDAAKKGYLSILKTQPHQVEALHSLGILYAQQDQFSEAITYLQAALTLEPKNLLISIHLANILKFQGLYSQATELLDAVLQEDPHNITALNNLGAVYYAQAKFKEAIACYRSAIEKRPDFVDAYYNLGLALNKADLTDQAITAFENLLVIDPEHFAARFHLACTFMKTDQFENAISTFLKIIATHPNHFETQSNLATCYLKTRSLQKAKQHYLAAFNLMPQDTQILFNLGVISAQQGQLDEAIQYYQRILPMNSNDFAVHNNLGVAFLAKQHLNFALHHFQEALRIQPNNISIQHTVNVLSQQQPLLTSPPEYVQSLFDSYADHYEPHLLTALEYKIPELLLQAILKVRPSASWEILDLGCGTGLCGQVLKPYAKKLVGIDLSEKMLAVAAQKNIYDELIQDELTSFLEQQHQNYDLIMAGDVLVYIGDLTAIFKLVHQTLKDGGLLVFNTEITHEDDFKMSQSGRFLHKKYYLENLAVTHHFKVLYYETVITRMQNNEPVYGHLLVLEKD